MKALLLDQLASTYYSMLFVLFYCIFHNFVFRIELEKNLKNEDNKAPAILMLASNRESYATTHCLAKKLSQTFSTQCENESGIKVVALMLF